MEDNTNIESDGDNKNTDTIISNKYYPPFGDPLDFSKLNSHAIRLCPTFFVNSSGFIVKPTIASEDSVKAIDGDKNTGTEKSCATNDLSKTHSKRKKTKKTRIIAEYQASQIPDNKGSTLSIDDLVKFVNGNEKCSNHLTNTFYRGHNNTSKSDKKHRAIFDNCKEPNGSEKVEGEGAVNAGQSSLNTADISVELQENVVGQREMPKGCETESGKVDSVDEGNIPDEYFGDHDIDNDAFFQVVRKKSRHKKCVVHLPTYASDDKVFATNTRKYISRNHTAAFPVMNETIVVGDKETLNSFINKLWIEFQARYEEYIRDESKKIQQTSDY